MATKKITINELKKIIKKIIKENYEKGDYLRSHSEALSVLSDVWKDVYGSRPNLSYYRNMSKDEIYNMIDQLSKESELQAEHEKQVEEKNIEKFEMKIQDLIKSGAKDRETALRWLYDEKDYYDDYDFFLDMGIYGSTESGRQLHKEFKSIKWD